MRTVAPTYTEDTSMHLMFKHEVLVMLMFGGLWLCSSLFWETLSMLLCIEQGCMAKSAWEENHGFTRSLLRSPCWRGFELLEVIIILLF